MKRNYTPEEAKQEHRDKLGPKLGPVFHELWNDLAWLQIKWREYRELFGTTPDRLDLLNSSAGLFFRIIQDTMWEESLLHLSRLTDRATVAGRKNLTIRLLPALCDDDKLRASVATLVEKAIAATEFARDWRNRHVGHRDLDLVLNSGAKALAPASRTLVSQAISAIHAVLNEISEQLLNSTLSTEVITPGDGALALLYTLHDGVETGRAREERIRSGHFEPNDLKPRKV
ncbi:MAG: hypothetical protein EHM23_25905 [Acidobacteria bacterium]|nr:MAG: hypothetical protein EHM23_25905 [Acidobacteriota bacterium]